MKLRIRANSVRLRLTKTEIEDFSSTGYLEEHTSFGNKSLVWALQSKTGINTLSAEFDGLKITVFIPALLVKDWAINDVIGFDEIEKLNNNDFLSILVEKDFKCLEDSREDQSDNFDNPNKIC